MSNSETEVSEEENHQNTGETKKRVSFKDVYGEGKEKPYLSGYAAHKRAWLHEAFGSIAGIGGATLGGLLTLHRIEMYLLKKFPKQWVLHAFIAGPPTAAVAMFSSGLAQGIVRGCFPPKYVEKGPRWLESDSYAGLRVAQLEKTSDMSQTRQHYLQASNAELLPTLPSYIRFFFRSWVSPGSFRALENIFSQAVSKRFLHISNLKTSLMMWSLTGVGMGGLSLCGYILMPPFAVFLIKGRHVISETLEGVGFDIQDKYFRKSSST
eukprot:jgi/Galph1/2907/GphlegSOOS_G1571.1